MINIIHTILNRKHGIEYHKLHASVRFKSSIFAKVSACMNSKTDNNQNSQTIIINIINISLESAKKYNRL